MAEIAITSSATIMVGDSNHSSGFSLEDIKNVVVDVKKARGTKCKRCWKFDSEINSSDICKRCSVVIEEIICLVNKFFFIFLLIIIDFTTKKIVYNYLTLNSFIPIIYFLDIAHIHNYGISFGLFSGLIPSWVIVLIGSVITAFLTYMMITASNKIEKWGLAVIIAGGAFKYC